MAYYLTSAFKEPIRVELRAWLAQGSYASIDHPAYKEPIVVPCDSLEERIELDDLL